MSENSRQWRIGLIRFSLWTTLVSYLILVVVWRVFCTSFQIWDDAFMIMRYADHLIRCHSLIWNIGEQPLYGPTSLAYSVYATVFRAIFPSTPIAAAFSSSASAGLLFLCLFILMVETCIAEPRGKNAAVAVALVTVIIAQRQLAVHFESGMDTTFAMAYLCGYIIVAHRFARTGSFFNASITGIVGGAAFAVRPDLLVFSFSVPSAMLLIGQIKKRIILILLTITCVILLIQVTAAALLLGSPLPLPFYAKSLHSYSPHIWEIYSKVPVEEFIHYLKSICLLLFFTVAALVIYGKKWLDWDAGLSLGLLVGTAGFILYYLTCVLQIMPYQSRFYYPTFPAFLYLGCTGAARVYRFVSTRFEACPRVRNMWWIIWAVLMAVTGGYALFHVLSLKDNLKSWSHAVPAFDLEVEYRARYSRYLYRLDAFSKLGDDLVIAATEIGRPAALNPSKKIIDLTGLNDKEIALHGFNADQILSKRKPDLIYMPHRDYVEMTQELVSSKQFTDHYEYYPESVLNTFMGIAIRKDSRYYSEMRSIIGSSDECVSSLEK